VIEPASEVNMKVRDKLLQLGIYVPENANGYRYGKGALNWLATLDGGSGTGIFLMPITREQYEGMMMAGLLCSAGRAVEAPYVAPPSHVHAPEASVGPDALY
jgi:hypothetical protein